MVPNQATDVSLNIDIPPAHSDHFLNFSSLMTNSNSLLKQIIVIIWGNNFKYWQLNTWLDLVT